MSPTYDPLWRRSGVKWIKSSVHGFEMPCDLTIFTGRQAYYLRRWNEAETQSIILTLLHRGDTFVDIGANVGMASLTAAKAVGPAGHIISFEPNPRIAGVLKQAIQRNRLQQIEVRVSAIGPRPGSGEFFVPDDNHGEASLGTCFEDRPGKLIRVEVVDGTSLETLSQCEMIKVDVEGFEAHVIEAVEDVIVRFRPYVLTEIVDRHLKRCGSSVRQVFERFQQLDYVGFVCSYVPSGLTRFRAGLESFDWQRPSDCNVLWVPSAVAGEVAKTEFLPVRR